jgi:hypothetical protein
VTARDQTPGVHCHATDVQNAVTQATARDSEGRFGGAVGAGVQGGQHRHDRCAGLLASLGMVCALRVFATCWHACSPCFGSCFLAAQFVAFACSFAARSICQPLAMHFWEFHNICNSTQFKTADHLLPGCKHRPWSQCNMNV